MEGLLGIERHESVALVTLQRPDKRNALSIALRMELADSLQRLARDDDIGAIVLTGAGSAFCSGMDTTQFGGDREHRERLVETSGASFGALSRCPKPTIAAVNGPAIAGGFALALLCDIRLAAPSARFGFAELPRGIPPSYAAARAALPAALARELCLTGRVLDAREARAHGVVSELVDDGNVVGRAVELGRAIGGMPRRATLETKRRILLEAETAWGALLDEEMRVFRAAVLDRDPPDSAA